MLHKLELGRAAFESRLRLVGFDDWDLPTPCDGWSVRDLVAHVVGGNVMATKLLQGASKDEAMSHLFGHQLSEEPWVDFEMAAQAQADAFAAPGSLDRICHHPTGDVPGSEIVLFRIADITLHSWDLARSIGADETLDPQLVEAVWQRFQQMGTAVATSGRFGSGPSGTVRDDAPLQTRLLDLSGRRP